MLNKKEIEDLLKPFLYEEHGFTMMDFEGTRSDYKVPMVFLKITPQGNLKLREVTGYAQGGMPDKFRNRVAKQRERNGEHYWFIEDGTGSMILKPERRLPS